MSEKPEKTSAKRTRRTPEERDADALARIEKQQRAIDMRRLRVTGEREAKRHADNARGYLVERQYDRAKLAFEAAAKACEPLRAFGQQVIDAAGDGAQ